MSKRQNHEGSIYLRGDGRWAYSWTAPDSKRRTKYAKTAADAQRLLRDTLSKQDRGLFVEPSALTVDQWLTTWLREYAALSVRPSTYTAYEVIIRKHLIPALGKNKLQSIRPEVIQAFVNQKARDGYASASVRRYCNVLRSAFQQAIANKIRYDNPMSAVKLPRLEHKAIEYLSAEELAALLPILPDNTHGRAIRFILGTGLRVGELCGLRWCDIEPVCINVNQITYTTKRDGKPTRIVDSPKTKAGKRTIPLNIKLRAILEEQRQAQRAERVRAGSAWGGGTPCKGEQYVFATATGLPGDRTNIARCLRIYLQKAGVASRGVHALRHTFATRWVQGGGDIRTLSDILGHSDIATTMRLYVHTDNATKQRGMDAMASLI